MATGDSLGASNTILMIEAPMFSSYISIPLSTDKLDQSKTSSIDYADFLKWYEHCQNFGSTAFVAHTGNSFACLSQFASLSPWVLDSTIIDYIFGNKALFSSLSTSGYLPTVTLANGSKTKSQGIGTAQPFPSLSVNFVHYFPGSPFNLLSISRLTQSLDYAILLLKNLSIYKTEAWDG